MNVSIARGCFAFGCEAVNGSGEAVGGLVKSRVGRLRPPALASRQLLVFIEKYILISGFLTLLEVETLGKVPI